MYFGSVEGTSMKIPLHWLAIALASLLSAGFAQGQNLFETDDFGSGSIHEFAPNGGSSTFASGLDYPDGLAFNSAGDLFEADEHSGHIYEFTPNGGSSTFASGVGVPLGLAFNSAGNLFEADSGSDQIYEFTPNGGSSTFASGLYFPQALAFQGVTLPIPEPSTWALVGLGAVALLGVRRRN
jgi:hypothetical protein